MVKTYHSTLQGLNNNLLIKINELKHQAALLRLCFRSSASQVSLDGPTTSYQSPNHDQPAELHCRGTVSVEQSSRDWRPEMTLHTFKQ